MSYQAVIRNASNALVESGPVGMRVSILQGSPGAKTNLGLGNVDNTTDILKPVSSATQTALNIKAPIDSPAFTGTPLAPTATTGDNTTRIATTAFVASALIASFPAS